MESISATRPGRSPFQRFFRGSSNPIRITISSQDMLGGASREEEVYKSKETTEAVKMASFICPNLKDRLNATDAKEVEHIWQQEWA